MTKPYLKTLNIIDIVILTAIFFGVAIFNSNDAYIQSFVLHPQNSSTINDDVAIFDDFGNIWSIIQEVIFLVIAFIYLKYRRFDFGQLNFNINHKTALKVMIYFLIAGLVATGIEYIIYWLQYSALPQYHIKSTHYFSYITPTLIVFALLNGFFEELFFVGLIFATPKAILKYMLIFSLLVRFSFHTYQGLISAFVITTLGVVFIYFRQKDDELIPFMLTHSLFDIFGLGLPLFLLDL